MELCAATNEGGRRKREGNYASGGWLVRLARQKGQERAKEAKGQGREKRLGHLGLRRGGNQKMEKWPPPSPDARRDQPLCRTRRPKELGQGHFSGEKGNENERLAPK